MAERRYTVVFYGALLVAAVATYGVYRVLEATKASGKIKTRAVVIALADLPEGVSIDRAAVGTSQWPVQTIPSGAFESTDSVTGRVTRVPVFKGEPLVPGRLAPSGTGPGIEVKIAPGKRAMAVRINDVAGLGGLMQPNSRVDMLVTLREGVSRDGQVAKLFMENLRVLSVGSRVQRSAENDPINATTATLEVTPQEAEQIAVAMKQGSIQLVLRGYGDPDNVTTKGATSDDVLERLRDPRLVRVRSDTPAPPLKVATRPRTAAAAPAAKVLPPPPTKPDSSTVRVYRGGTVSQQKFEKPDSVPPRATP